MLMKKILIYVNYTASYSVDREIMILSNVLSSLYKIEIVTLKKNDDIYINSKNINIKYLKYDNNIKFINDIKFNNDIKNSYLEFKPDVVISTSIRFNKCISNEMNCNKLFWEHFHAYDSNYITSLNSSLVGFNKLIVPSNNKELYKMFNNVEVVYIPNMIDLQESISKLDNHNILCVSKLIDDKNIDKVIDAIRIVKETYDDVCVHLVGEGVFRSKLEEYIDTNGLGNNIIFYGILTDKEISELYLNCSIYIATNIINSSALALLDALGYGLPVITFKDDNLTNIINNGINGYQVESVNELSKRISELFADHDELINMGKCARESSLVFDKNRLTSEWVKLL